MTKTRVANGIFWVEIPEADLRILCGCPADSVKHLSKNGKIAPTSKAGVSYETGPNAILLSDTPIQKGSFSNLAEFPLLQMFYRQGMLIPGHPNNTGRKPLLIGLGDQVRSLGDYLFRGNYGLASAKEIEACGVSHQIAEEMFRVKRWFAFDRIRPTSELVETRALDAEAVELAPGVVVHRKGFNRYEFLAGGESVEVDLTLGPAEEYEPTYTLPAGGIRREAFSVVHIGEGDGWDIARPCMGSIVCHEGRLYLVDAGPHITRSLEALGIGPGDIEGIFQTHVHDDHFAGLTSLVRSERRMKYFAVPYVRATTQKKLAALMRFDEERFSRFFEVHDLVHGRWNNIEGLDVRPLFSPHPVETTVFFFRVKAGSTTRTYAHLADIPSFEVLGQMAAPGGRPPGLSEEKRAGFVKELLAAVDLKKIDVGGGPIHGNAPDFVSDRSRIVVLSHGITSIPAAFHDNAKTVSFGDADVLLEGDSPAYLRRIARSLLASWFPGSTAQELEPLAHCPVTELGPGSLIRAEQSNGSEHMLILSGVAAEADSARRLSTGSLFGLSTLHAVSAVTALRIPGEIYDSFIARAGVSDALRRSASNRVLLSRCPLFKGIRSESVLNYIAASMQKLVLTQDEGPTTNGSPELFILAEGELDLEVGGRLIESIRPGAFWGEERIVSAAPVIWEARAATPCVCYAVPAGTLRDIPMVQWELQEAFERRLKSFRSGFRFEWSEAFAVGVKALDDQHRSLFTVVNDLSELIGKTRVIAGHDEKKKELLDLVRLHFKSEESLMQAHGYQRLAQQRKAHEELVARLERFLGAGERRKRPRAETAMDYLKDWLIRHVLLEDLGYREFFADKGVS